MARRKRTHVEGPHDDEDRWLLPYSDLIPLLFVLFVLMCAISTTDTRKLTQLAQSLSAAFNANVLTGQQAISINDGQDTTVQQDQTSSGTSPVQSDLQAIKDALEDYAIGQRLGGEVDVGIDPYGIVIRRNDALLFSPGRANLDDHALNLVKQVVTIIKPLPN